MPNDIEADLLNNAQRPNLLVRPSVTVLSASPVPGKAGEFVAELMRGVSWLSATAPCRSCSRAGRSSRCDCPSQVLVAKPGGDGLHAVRQGSELLVVLENPSAFEYKSVRGRLRFANEDVCAFDAESFGSRCRIIEQHAEALRHLCKLDAFRHTQIRASNPESSSCRGLVS